MDVATFWSSERVPSLPMEGPFPSWACPGQAVRVKSRGARWGLGTTGRVISTTRMLGGAVTVVGRLNDGSLAHFNLWIAQGNHEEWEPWEPETRFEAILRGVV